MGDLYMLSDIDLTTLIGKRLKSERLRQNLSQADLSFDSQVSLSTVKKIESGAICSFDSFIRILRTLGLLDKLSPLAEEPEISPTEYYNYIHSGKSHTRKRASSK